MAACKRDPATAVAGPLGATMVEGASTSALHPKPPQQQRSVPRRVSARKEIDSEMGSRRELVMVFFGALKDRGRSIVACDYPCGVKDHSLKVIARCLGIPLPQFSQSSGLRDSM